MEQTELQGKVAIVTGGAVGIGRAIATELAAAGAKTVIADLQGSSETADQIASANGAQTLGIEVDVSSGRATLAMAEEVIRRLGGVDILVNNAALFAELTSGPFETIPDDEWRRVLEVNVIGPNLCAKAVVPAMRRAGGGRIVNIASGTIFRGIPHRLHYVTSKGAVVAFTRSLARELGPDNILVNALAPGFTLSDGVLGHEEEFARTREEAPRSRSIQRDQIPADIAGAARFLCGPGASFITGQTLVVDGGAAFH